MANRLKTVKKTPDPGKLTTEKVEKLAIKQVVRDERTHKITGAILLMLCFFFFIAFTSYLFTWQVDQDIVLSKGLSILAPNEYPIANLLGSFGAYISHVFINKGFGIASFLFCSFLFVTGVNLLFNKKIFSVTRNLKYLVSGLFVFSLSLAFLFRGFEFSWGGDIGKLLSGWFVGLIGNVGTTIFILVAFFSYMIWRFNPVLHIPSFSFPKKKTEEAIEDLPGEHGEADEVVITGNKIRKKSQEATVTKEEMEESGPMLLIEKDVYPPHQPSTVQLDHTEAELPPKKNKQAISSESLELEIKANVPETKKEAAEEKVAKLPPYDPVLDLRDYKYPQLDLLHQHGSEKIVMDAGELEANKNQIINTLKNYDIAIQKIVATVGPTVTLYEIIPAAGVRISRIKNLEDDIALSLSALGYKDHCTHTR